LSNQWFRSWHGAPTDPKWLGIARKAGVAPGIVAAVVWALLDRASQATERGSVAGYDADGLACFMGCEPEQVEHIIALMHEKGILAGDAFTGWEKHQPKREDHSTDRVKEYRERKRTQANTDETQCNAEKRAETLDTDTDTEEENISAHVAPETKPSRKVVQEVPDGFDAFWQAYPKRDGNMDRKGAVKAFGPAVQRAGGHEVITRAASRYATHCREKGKAGTEFVKQARAWLNGDLWAEWLPPAPPTEVQSSRVYVTTGTNAMDAWDDYFKRTKGKLAPRDQRGGWWFDSEFPPLQERAA
jgi:hypothetical protein